MEHPTPSQSSGRYGVIAFLSKVPSKTLDEFRDYYENTHIPLALRMLRAASVPLPLVYTRRYLDAQTPIVTANGQVVGFDCMTELQFASKEDFERFWVAPLMQGEGGRVMGEDEARFIDRGKTVAYQFDIHQTEGGFHEGI